MVQSRTRMLNTTVMKLLASAGILGGSLALSATSYAGPVSGLYRIAPQNAPHKSFDLPGDGCPYNAGNAPSTLALYSHVNTCATGDQRWWIQDMGGSQFEIRSGGSGGKCLDIDNGGAGTRLGTYTCTGGTGQRWFFDLMTSGELYGTWKIRSVRDNRVIDLSNGNTANGTVIQMWSDAGVAAQRWILWGNGGMHKDFEDDMNGSSVDTNVWNKANFGAGRFNGELQKYDPGTTYVYETGGHMTLISHTTGCTGSGCYTSGRVSSKGKRWYRNGMFSARIHYYENGGGNMGAWPAFWILGNNINEDPVTAATIGGSCWPTSGAREIDIWEWPRNNNGASYINNGIIGNGCNAPTHQSTNTSSWNWNDWIVAAVQFDAGRVKFFRGGVKTHDIPDSGLVNEDFAFVFNMAVGGALGGSTADYNNSSKFASIDIDWAAHETY